MSYRLIGLQDTKTLGLKDFWTFGFKCLESGPSIRPSDYSGTALTQKIIYV